MEVILHIGLCFLFAAMILILMEYLGELFYPVAKEVFKVKEKS